MKNNKVKQVQGAQGVGLEDRDSRLGFGDWNLRFLVCKFGAAVPEQCLGSTVSDSGFAF